MRRRTTPWGSGDYRGVSLSVFVASVLVALLMVAGLVVDGGAQVRAERRAQVVAAQAARAGADASATSRLAGGTGVAEAIHAARATFEAQGVTGSVEVAAGVITVSTTITTSTIFLCLIGTTTLTSHGTASAVLTTG